VRATAGAVLAICVVSGCGGSDRAETKDGLEKADIKVAVPSIVDDSPLFLAQKSGFFRQEGLTVTPVPLTNGAEGLLRLQSGAVDLTWSSHPNLLSGIDSDALKARIVADDYATAKDLFLVATMPGSGIKKPADLVGKKVSVNALKGLGPLLLAATLKGYGVAVGSPKLVPMEFPAMPAALQNRSIAEALATVSPILLTTERGAPHDKSMRRALITWVFNTPRRTAGPPPDDLKPAVRWLEANTVKLTGLTDPTLVRKALDAIATKLDGAPAAATTIARKRAVFYGALSYGVELGHFDQHPMDRIKWVTPKNDAQVDRRVVVNSRQGRALLAAVREEAPELEAFFGCMYYAALRPEEALHLSEDEYERPKRKVGWGWLHLTGATVAVGRDWGNTEGTVENRGLKHRAKNAVRDVPAPPALCTLLDRHIEEFKVGPGQKLFVTRRGPGGRYVPTRGRPIPNNTYTRVWQKARRNALTPAQQRSPLAKVPYHLRHAAVSTWLNAGVPATQVAEWSGQALAVLLRVYAKCIDGQDSAARRRMEEGYRITDDLDESNESDAP
jgi:ABC-type nitrate/sulfonate/bicarbonate transport system substrate-binding protein